MYKDGLYNPYRPLDGFLEGELLLMVGLLALVVSSTDLREQGFKCIFIGPSANDTKRASKATKTGNAKRMGMKKVTPGSIAYAATIVRILTLMTGLMTNLSGTGLLCAEQQAFFQYVEGK